MAAFPATSLHTRREPATGAAPGRLAPVTAALPAVVLGALAVLGVLAALRYGTAWHLTLAVVVLLATAGRFTARRLSRRPVHRQHPEGRAPHSRGRPA